MDRRKRIPALEDMTREAKEVGGGEDILPIYGESGSENDRWDLGEQGNYLVVKKIRLIRETEARWRRKENE